MNKLRVFKHQTLGLAAAQTVSPFFHEKLVRSGRGAMGICSQQRLLPGQSPNASFPALSFVGILSQRLFWRHPFGGALKKAHCDAALEPMVSVENAGKLFERAGGKKWRDEKAVIKTTGPGKPILQRVFARAAETEGTGSCPQSQGTFLLLLFFA